MAQCGTFKVKQEPEELLVSTVEVVLSSTVVMEPTVVDEEIEEKK